MTRALVWLGIIVLCVGTWALIVGVGVWAWGVVR